MTQFGRDDRLFCAPISRYPAHDEPRLVVGRRASGVPRLALLDQSQTGRSHRGFGRREVDHEFGAMGRKNVFGVENGTTVGVGRGAHTSQDRRTDWNTE